MGINWTYCDYFTIYTYIDLLCCTPEINKMLLSTILQLKINKYIHKQTNGF